MRRWIKRGLIAALALAVVSGATAWWLLCGSLATLEGRIALAGLAAPARVDRDANGVADLAAGSQTDAMRALGYVHAQERYFEMDLLRRSAAGELSALFGAIALPRDRAIRTHRLRARVLEQWSQIAGDERAVLEAYRDGVNAGLRDLRVRPWPYLLLGSAPEPWRTEDSALVILAMFIDLQDEGNARELALWRLRQALPTALFDLLDIGGGEWDAPLIGGPTPRVILPTADIVDLRLLPMPDDRAPQPTANPLAWLVPVAADAEPLLVGSNNFAVAGALTGDRRAIVANDMHLGLRAPNIWFRVRLRYPDPDAGDAAVELSGFSLPGVPGIVVGSNRHVAWGFTNSYGDWLDWYRVHWADPEHRTYRTRDGAEPVRELVERIVVKGAPDDVLHVRETRWGPILAQDGDDALALRWTAHAGGVNLALAGMARARNLDTALAQAHAVGIPAQNLVIADSDGRIAWQLLGRIPKRIGGCDPRAPIEPLDGCDWEGFVTDAPHLVDPAMARLWTANARTVDGEALSLLGDGGFALGARARQIRDDLLAREHFGEADLLDVALDDRSVFLRRWHHLLQENAGGDSPALSRLARLSARWDDAASTSARSYPLVRAWRLAVLARIEAGLAAPALVTLGPDFKLPYLSQAEHFAWPLLQQRPAHLLPRRYANWDELLDDAADEVLRSDALDARGQPRAWGERNQAHICHPLASALPTWLADTLCMPTQALPGDNNMPRVQGPSFGASERMVVSPGHEDEGFVHMPGGQSGHPLSPFWGAGHAAWVHGTPMPFLPGPLVYHLELTPIASAP